MIFVPRRKAWLENAIRDFGSLVASHALPSLGGGGLVATRTCPGGLVYGLLLRRQVGEHTTESRWLSRSSFSVNHEGVGSGGVQSVLTAPRRINPGAVASKGPVKSFCFCFCWVGRKRRVYFPFIELLGAYRLLLRRRTISTGGVKCCNGLRR